MKRTLRAFLFGFAALVSVVLVALFMLGTGPGLRMTTSAINSFISSEDSTIEITGLTGVLSGPVSVEQVSISDSKGTWLSVQGIEADVSRWALLSGQISASRLSVQAVDVERQPVAGQNQQQSSGGLPAIKAELDNIFVRSIALAQPVFGESAQLQLTGSVLLRDDPVDLSGALDLVRIDGTFGEIMSEWKVSPNSNELELKLTVQEPADGILARALNIHGLPAVDVRLAGQGPLDNWHSDLSIRLDGELTAQGAVSLAYTDDKQSISGSLEGRLAPLVPPTITPLFAGTTQIQIAAERDGENTFRIQNFSARSGLVSLEASGHVLSADNSVDLNAALTFGSSGSVVALDLGQDNPLEVGFTQLNTSLKGGLSEASWSLEGSLASVADGDRSLSGLSIAGQSQAIDFINGAGPLEVTLRTESLSTGQESLDALVGGAVVVNAKAGIKSGILSIDNSQISAGQITAEMTGEVDLAGQDFELDLSAEIAQQNAAPWDGLFGNQPAQVSARVSRDDEGLLQLSNVALESGNLGATATGKVSSQLLEFEGRASLVALSSLNASLTGALTADVELTGTPLSPQFNVDAQGDDITILEKPLEGLEFSVVGSAPQSGLMADVNLVGRYENQPISITASVRSSSDGAPQVDRLNVVVPGATAGGELRANASGILEGTLDLDITSLAQLGPLLLQEGLSGALDGRIVFGESQGVQAVNADLTSQTLDLGAALISSAQISAQVINSGGGPTIDATVNTASVNVSGTELRNMRSTVSGGLDSLAFTVDGLLRSDPLSVAGEFSSQHGTTTIEIGKVNGRIASIPVNLSQPATITLLDQGANLETVRLRVGEGQVVVSGSATDQLDFDVTVQSFPVTLLDNFAPTGLGQSGTINASAKITGSPSDPAVNYSATLANFSVAASREAQIPAIGVTANGAFASGNLTVNANATGGGMDLTAGGSVDVSGTPSFDLSVNGRAPFEFAAIPLSNAGILLEGGVTVALTVSGTSQSPVIQGRLSTENAVFIEENSALTVRDINGQIDFNGTRASIANMTGRLGTKGRLSVSGFVDIDPANGMPADIKLTVTDGTYSNGEIITTQFDADMEVSGALTRSAAIGGTVTLDRTDINIPEQLPSSIPMVDVKHLHASRAVAAQAKEIAPQTSSGGDGSQSGGVLQLDLTVSAPARIFLRGRGIDAEFGGSIQVTGTTSAPRAKGTFSMIRGRLDVLTQRFDFDRGTIVFAGPMDPNLDFQTTTTVSGTSYSIVVGGTASSPEISFTSSPTVPQDEILAKLFFGKDLSKLSPFQIAQLANAVSQLSGVNSGEGLLGRLRSLSGLANVDIVPDEEGTGAALGIGSYLNDRTYINVEKGLSGGAGKVTVDIDLTGNLKARGEARSDGETKAGIFFERDY